MTESEEIAEEKEGGINMELENYYKRCFFCKNRGWTRERMTGDGVKHECWCEKYKKIEND